MTRTGLRTTVVMAGLVVLAGRWLAPRVPPAAIPYLSILWIAAAAWLLYAAFLILKTWIGRAAAGIVVGLLALVPIAVTAMRPQPSLAIRLPCPRNWAWVPSWLLRPSPLSSVVFDVGDARVKICHGRPASRGRRMLGGKYVPFGRLWRTGANEPTTIISTGDLIIAGIPVPAGRTALYTIPGPESWEVILNRSTSQWGIESEYSDSIKALEIGRAILPSQIAKPPLERLTLVVEPEAGGKNARVDLVLRWESIRVRIPISAASR